jgi:hypothetical protein
LILPRGRWLIGGALAAALAFATYALAQAISYPAAQESIVIDASPIAAFDNRDQTRVRFGSLEFRGGLILRSKARGFGGISALRMEADGSRFLAVTDNGAWLRGRIVYEGDRPAGIADAEMAPLLGADGKPLAARGWFDTESIAEMDGKLYVGIERVEQIVRFDYAKDGLKARGQPIEVPVDFKSFKFNKSLECLASPPKGSPLAGKLIVVTEESLDQAGNLRSFIFYPDHVERFTVNRSDDFDVSDCTVLPPGDLLLLERRYSRAKGVAIRIRRVPLKSIDDGRLVDGKVLITADMGYQIDNMEGLGLHRDAQGRTVLTLISDDNFSMFQRTLLLQFTLVE